MYRNCIFCSADLKANDALERFPVGRSIAFDGEKGRLWAVCPKCARWNLAPLQERWEAIDDAERLFRDTRLRAQSENVGLAKLRDGTRLVRVGRALPGELALWRYGRSIERRQPRPAWVREAAGRVENAVTSGGGWLFMGGVMFGVPLAFTIGGAGVAWGVARLATEWIRYTMSERRVVQVLQDSSGRPVVVRRDDLDGARLSMPNDGKGVQLLVSYSAADRRTEGGRDAVVLRGEPARFAVARAMVHVNEKGAPRPVIEAGTGLIEEAGSPGELLDQVAREGHVLATAQRFQAEGKRIPLPLSLALEMALHQETERRALDGELAMLEAMWREAEEIASIADRLPDDLPAGEPPRLR